jgi:hypothetical protein
MDLRRLLIEAIGRRAPLQDLHALLVAFKNQGGGQQEAHDLLESMRIDASEEEDVILELMDFVVGYCSPSWRIWW